MSAADHKYRSSASMVSFPAPIPQRKLDLLPRRSRSARLAPARPPARSPFPLPSKNALHNRSLLLPSVVEAKSAAKLLEPIPRIPGQDLAQRRLLRRRHRLDQALLGAAIRRRKLETVNDGQQLVAGEVSENIALGGHGRRERTPGTAPRATPASRPALALPGRRRRRSSVCPAARGSISWQVGGET